MSRKMEADDVVLSHSGVDKFGPDPHLRPRMPPVLFAPSRKKDGWDIIGSAL